MMKLKSEGVSSLNFNLRSKILMNLQYISYACCVIVIHVCVGTVNYTLEDKRLVTMKSGFQECWT